MSGKAILKEIGSTLLYILVVLGITWLVITFVGQRTEVNGSSMEPTLSNNDKDVYKRQSLRRWCFQRRSKRTRMEAVKTAGAVG